MKERKRQELFKLLQIIFNSILIFQIIVDSHAILRNNTQDSLLPFMQFTPMTPSCILHKQYNSTTWKLILIQLNFIQTSVVLHELLCVYVFVHVYIYIYIKFHAIFTLHVNLCNHHHGQDIEQFCHHMDPSVYTYTVTSPFHVTIETTDCFSVNLSFQECHISGMSVCVLCIYSLYFLG